MGFTMIDKSSVQFISGEKYIFYSLSVMDYRGWEERGIIVPDGTIIGPLCGQVETSLITTNKNFYAPNGEYLTPHVPVEVIGYHCRGGSESDGLSVNGTLIKVHDVYPADTPILITANYWTCFVVAFRVLSEVES